MDKILLHSNVEIIKGHEKNIIKIKEAIDKLPGNTLENLIKDSSLPFFEKILISLDLAFIIDSLHCKTIVHRDIKSKNVMIMNNKQTKLIIFSNQAKFMRKKTINDNDINALRDPAKIEYDIWSFGYLLNELFSDNDCSLKFRDLYHNNLLFYEYPFTVSEKITNQKLINLITHLMKLDMTKEERTLAILHAKAILFELLYEEVKKTNFNYVFMSSCNTILEKQESKQTYLLFRKLEYYINTYKSIVSKSKEFMIQLIDSSMLEQYLVKEGHSFPDKESKKSFIRKVSKFLSRKLTLVDVINEKYKKIEDFYKVTLTPEIVTKFTQMIKINEINKKMISFNEKDQEYSLGEGGYAKVKKAKMMSYDIAIKFFANFNMEAFVKEISILKMFYHTKIPVIYGVFQYRKGEESELSINIAMELIKGVNLENILGGIRTQRFKFLELEKLIILIDLAIVIEYIHGNHLIHRDLKPDNILINNKLELKLIDFGISRTGFGVNSGLIPTKVIGTIRYMAPENYDYPQEDFESESSDNESVVENNNEESEESKLSKKRLNPYIDNKVDIWAFGLILIELFTCMKPWQDSKLKLNEGQIIAALAQLKSKYRIPDTLDSKLHKVAEMCLMRNPNERSSIKEVKEELLGVFFQKAREIKDLKEYYIMNYGLNDNTYKNLFYFSKKVQEMLLLYLNVKGTNYKISNYFINYNPYFNSQLNYNRLNEKGYLYINTEPEFQLDSNQVTCSSNKANISLVKRKVKNDLKSSHSIKNIKFNLVTQRSKVDIARQLSPVSSSRTLAPKDTLKYIQTRNKNEGVLNKFAKFNDDVILEKTKESKETSYKFAEPLEKGIDYRSHSTLDLKKILDNDITMKLAEVQNYQYKSYDSDEVTLTKLLEFSRKATETRKLSKHISSNISSTDNLPDMSVVGDDCSNAVDRDLEDLLAIKETRLLSKDRNRLIKHNITDTDKETKSLVKFKDNKKNENDEVSLKLTDTNETTVKTKFAYNKFGIEDEKEKSDTYLLSKSISKQNEKARNQSDSISKVLNSKVFNQTITKTRSEEVQEKKSIFKSSVDCAINDADLTKHMNITYNKRNQKIFLIQSLNNSNNLVDKRQKRALINLSSNVPVIINSNMKVNLNNQSVSRSNASLLPTIYESSKVILREKKIENENEHQDNETIRSKLYNKELDLSQNKGVDMKSTILIEKRSRKQESSQSSLSFRQKARESLEKSINKEFHNLVEGSVKLSYSGNNMTKYRNLVNVKEKTSAIILYDKEEAYDVLTKEKKCNQLNQGSQSNRTVHKSEQKIEISSKDKMKVNIVFDYLKKSRQKIEDFSIQSLANLTYLQELDDDQSENKKNDLSNEKIIKNSSSSQILPNLFTKLISPKSKPRDAKLSNYNSNTSFSPYKNMTKGKEGSMFSAKAFQTSNAYDTPKKNKVQEIKQTKLSSNNSSFCEELNYEKCSWIQFESQRKLQRNSKSTKYLNPFNHFKNRKSMLNLSESPDDSS